MISLTVEEVLNAPDLPSNLPQFEIISGCIKVERRGKAEEADSDSDKDDSSSGEESSSSSSE